MERQRTLRTSIRATGAGLHTGDRSDLILRPASPGTGIVFRRTDPAEPIEIPAHIDHAGSSLLSISLRRGDVAVFGVEHLLAAAAGLGIDNMYVDINGPEAPALDGSASPFVFLIQSAGVQEQSMPRRYIRVLRPVSIVEGDTWARLSPHQGLRISFWGGDSSPGDPGTDPVSSLEVTETSFIKEVSRARSSKMRETPTGQLVRDLATPPPGAPATEPRFEDEDSRSRVLAALGDLSLAGASILGALEGCGSNHALHLRLLRALLAETDAWEAIPPAEVASPITAIQTPSVA